MAPLHVPTPHRQQEGGAWERDPLVADERFLAVRVKGRGPVVCSACSHAGIVNIMRAVQALGGGVAPHAVVGGVAGGVMVCQAVPWAEGPGRGVGRRPGRSREGAGLL